MSMKSITPLACSTLTSNCKTDMKEMRMDRCAELPLVSFESRKRLHCQDRARYKCCITFQEISCYLIVYYLMLFASCQCHQCASIITKHHCGTIWQKLQPLAVPCAEQFTTPAKKKLEPPKPQHLPWSELFAGRCGHPPTIRGLIG